MPPAPGPVTPPALTGERTVAGLWHENYWFRRHEAGYRAALEWVDGPVVDAGCGEGDGLEALRTRSASVAGVDYDGPSLARVRARGGAVALANLVALPLADGVVGTVTSLQVVEHLWSLHDFLAECARVLRPGGRLVVTTPNRLTFSPGLGRGAKPRNVFHVRELDAVELAGEVARHLEVEHLAGLHHGPRLGGTDVVERQLAGPWDGWPSDLAELVAGVRADDFVVRTDAVDESLDLLLVARR